MSFSYSYYSLLPTDRQLHGCPRVLPAVDVDLAAFVARTWYVQAQQVTAFQALDQLYCALVSVDSLVAGAVPGFDGDASAVNFYSNQGAVNGPPLHSDGSCLRVPYPELPSNLLIAPCGVPNSKAVPFWIVAVGPLDAASGAYEWVLATGGQPTVKLADGCAVSPTSQASGLWLLGNTPSLALPAVDAAFLALGQFGVSLSTLVVVPQDGCLYQNATSIVI
jgi:hypothetical protein